MDEKITAIRKALSKNFNSAPVKYVDAEGCHRFNLELPRVTHRVNFSLEVLERHDAVSFKRLCKGVATYLKRNPTGKPRQVLLTKTGIVEEEVESQGDQDEPVEAASSTTTE
ncbi:MAG TPA: hypothetical protein VMW70_00130 [Burkholderiales bacterium]|nr:hypothetical protein [Burkholderiales bacterium]